MSVELREIKRRIVSTRQVRRVTGALQKVAAARLAQDRRAIERAARYEDALRQTAVRLLAAEPDISHPLMRTTPGAGTGLLAFGSERGLCGGFNRELLEEAQRFLQAHDDGSLRVVVMGKALHRRLRRQAAPRADYARQPLRPHARSPGRASLIRELLAPMEAAFLRGDLSEVYVLYSRFRSGLRQTPTCERLLPMRFDGAGTAEAQAFRAATFEPGPDEILADLLPRLLYRQIDLAFLNSHASENAARQVVMTRATENAEDLHRRLVGAYRHLRQESITTEMIELAGGALWRQAV